MTLREIAPGIHQLDDATVYTISSRSKPDLDHLVIHHKIEEEGAWHCTCPAPVVECWHVHEIRKAITEET